MSALCPTEERWLIYRLPESVDPTWRMAQHEPPLTGAEVVEVARASEVEDWKRVAAEQENRAKLQEDRARDLQAEVEGLREALTEALTVLADRQLEVERLREASVGDNVAFSPEERCETCGGTVKNRHRVACSWSKHGYLCTDPFHDRKPEEREVIEGEGEEHQGRTSIEDWSS